MALEEIGQNSLNPKQSVLNNDRKTLRQSKIQAKSPAFLKRLKKNSLKDLMRSSSAAEVVL